MNLKIIYALAPQLKPTILGEIFRISTSLIIKSVPLEKPNEILYSTRKYFIRPNDLHNDLQSPCYPIEEFRCQAQ